jgi:hypothetical protein
MIHHKLEGGWCIREPKGHHEKLVKSIPAAKGGISIVAFPYTNEMTALFQVYLRKESATTEAIL